MRKILWIPLLLIPGYLSAAQVYDNNGTKLDIGGRVEFRGDFLAKEDGSDLDGSMFNKSRLRFNIGIDEAINEQYSALGFYEAEQSIKSESDNKANETFTQRYLFLGVKSPYGNLTIGKQDTANVHISQMSDIGIFTGDQKAFIAIGNEQVNNTFGYVGDFDKLDLRLSYVTADQGDYEDGYGAVVDYYFPFGLHGALGYSSQDHKNVNEDQFSVGLSYEYNMLYTALTYTSGTSLGGDFNGYEYVAKVTPLDDTSLFAIYQNQKLDGDQLSNFVELSGEQRFSHNFKAYLAYKINNLDKKIMSDGKYIHQDLDNTLRLGLRLNF